MPLVGHIVRKVGLAESLAAGQKMIGHAEEITYNPPFHVRNSDPNEPFELDPQEIPQVVEMMSRNRAWLIPTLEAFQTIIDQIEDLEELLSREPMRYISEQVKRTFGWLPPHNDRIRRLSAPLTRKRLRLGFEFQKRLVLELQRGGVGLLAGTDVILPGIVPGFSLHDELQNFVDLGLPPYQALKTATQNPAGFLGKTREFGTVAVERRADLVLLEGNPLDRISEVRNIAGVMVRGRWIPKSEIEEQLVGLTAH